MKRILVLGAGIGPRADDGVGHRDPGHGAPGGEGQLVTVSVLLDVENPEDDYPGHWSALVVLDPEGGTYPVVRPQRRGHELQPAYLVDLDGDGIDAIVFRSDDVHSGYTYLAVWDGSAYRNLRLTGSGG